MIARSMLTPDLRPLDEGSGLPVLPAVEIAIHRSSGRLSEPAQRLSSLIRELLSAG